MAQPLKRTGGSSVMADLGYAHRLFPDLREVTISANDGFRLLQELADLHTTDLDTRCGFYTVANTRNTTKMQNILKTTRVYGLRVNIEGNRHVSR